MDWSIISFTKKDLIFAGRAKIGDEEVAEDPPDEPRVLLLCLPLLVAMGGHLIPPLEMSFTEEIKVSLINKEPSYGCPLSQIRVAWSLLKKH